MPDAVLVEVADAIVTLLKDGGPFARPIDPVRNYGTKDTKLTELKTLKVDVVPVRHAEATDQTRGHLTYDTEHDIVIRYRFDRGERDECGLVDKEEIDQLVLLTEQLHEYLIQKTLADDYASEWKASRILWCPYKSDLRNNHQFTGLIRATFETDKAKP